MERFFNLAGEIARKKGYKYYKENRVKFIQKQEDETYVAKVEGRKIYDVLLNIEHPLSSKCNCSQAKDKRIICKHKVAALMAICPDLESKYFDSLKNKAEYQERMKEYIMEDVLRYVERLSLEDLRQIAIEYLCVEQEEKYSHSHDNDYINRNRF